MTLTASEEVANALAAFQVCSISFSSRLKWFIIYDIKRDIYLFEG
jgi:hypothetical protein